MNRFIERAVRKANKIEKDQLVSLLKAVSQEYQLMEMVYDSLTDGVIVVDKTNTIELINKSAERFIPVDTKNISQKSVWKVIRDRNIASFVKETIMSEENARDQEFSIKSSNGRSVVALSIMPLVQKGVIRGSIIHIEDVTEKKEQAARLSRAERLASLTTLTASVAHEIKNPLAAISIHIQLIQKSMKKNQCNQDFIAKHLDVINDEVERLNGTIVDFLFAVRPMDMTLHREDINNLLSDLIELVYVELKEAGIELKYTPGKNLSQVLIDEKYLKQTFLNILKNAIAALTDISNPLLTITSRSDAQWIYIDFEDNGCGIPDETMEKIFEPYFTTKDFGSGLGLTVVYKVIQEHKGELVVDSTVGKGSVFTIKLPIDKMKTHLIEWDNDK